MTGYTPQEFRPGKEYLQQIQTWFMLILFVQHNGLGIPEITIQ